MSTFGTVITDQATRLVLPHVSDEWEDFQAIADKAGLRFSTVVAMLANLKVAGAVMNDGRNWKTA